MTISDLHILAIDCCSHVQKALHHSLSTRVTSVPGESTNRLEEESREQFDLIVIGVSRYPIRRLFINNIRRFFRGVPILVLRRECDYQVAGGETICGEFIISDRQQNHDLEMVKALRRVLPISPCEHMKKGGHYDIVRNVIRVIAANYSNPELDLNDIARELVISPRRLSHILNKEVGVNFRQLLRQTRIEEAKHMLASEIYSVKEVAARVGFSDSHYFSRSFRELTGLNASEYHTQDPISN